MYAHNRSWTVKQDVLGECEGLRYTVHLSRDLVSILLVTYFPTVLINLINQATNYISSNKYDMIITVNITCMMVLSGIYLSVSNSLPTTVQIKPVEVWLLFSLIYPVLVILINIFIQRAKDSKSNVVPLIKTEKLKARPSNCRNISASHLELVAYYILPAGYIVFVICYAFIHASM